MSRPLPPEEAGRIVAAAEAAHQVAYLIIGDLQSGQPTYMDDIARRVDELEAEFGPMGRYGLIRTLAGIADAHGARGDPA